MQLSGQILWPSARATLANPTAGLRRSGADGGACSGPDGGARAGSYGGACSGADRGARSGAADGCPSASTDDYRETITVRRLPPMPAPTSSLP